MRRFLIEIVVAVVIALAAFGVAALVLMSRPRCTCVLGGDYAMTDSPEDCPKHGEVTP